MPGLSRFAAIYAEPLHEQVYWRALRIALAAPARRPLEERDMKTKVVRLDTAPASTTGSPGRCRRPTRP